jgi:outer membrane usher protein
VNVTAAWEKVATTGPDRQQHGLLTLTMPLGSSASLRGSFDTRGKLGSLEYSRFQPDEIDTFGVRAALSRSEDDLGAAGDVSYNNNRFAAVLSHSLIAENNLGSIRTQETRLSLATQLAFAGGSFAVGRPVGPRFAVVAAHPTLEGASVTVRQGAGRSNPQARTGPLGPALAPAGNSYSAGEVRLDVDRLPPGYDIGSSQYTLVPGPASGYRITVGSDASHMLLGTALAPGGAPLSLLGGTLTLKGDPEAEPVLVFTNRAGRFAGNGLKPGTYELTLGTDDQYRTTVVIPAKSSGVIELGVITLKEEGQ